ncbi:hypothetical protein CEXT_397431 [Caerostris extrusa]|uniref:Uncharacterized protein n=1 Tax=Caerostris extrusa TaxID=172846 RepID=A0AAV4Q1T3_CAEEX|nr:hypothetical protein CEXT_397431 [Caerostris extrusa]
MTRRSNESDVRLLLKGRMEEERDHDVEDEGDRYVCLRGHPRSDSGLALLGLAFVREKTFWGWLRNRLVSNGTECGRTTKRGSLRGIVGICRMQLQRNGV